MTTLEEFAALPIPIEAFVEAHKGSLAPTAAYTANALIDKGIAEIERTRDKMKGNQYVMERLAMTHCLSILDNLKVDL